MSWRIRIDAERSDSNIDARTADTFFGVLLIPGTAQHRHIEQVLAAARLAVRLAEADSNAANADAVGGSDPNHPQLWIATDGRSLERGGIRGLARTVMCEYPADVMTHQLVSSLSAPGTISVWSAVVPVFGWRAGWPTRKPLGSY